MDNWTLEDSGELLSEGLKGEQASVMRFSEDGKSYFYEDLNWDMVAFECLAQTLSNVVLADVCYVDADNSGSWAGRYDCLGLLTKADVIRPRSFGQHRERWVPIREAIVDDLIVCPEMRESHEENKRAFIEDREMPDEMLSQILHGGAGMMARARLAEMAYVTHPQRERLVERGAFMAYQPSAQHRFSRVLQSTRMSMFERTDSPGFFAQLRLPPLAIQIINEANGTDDLLTTALQMRERYRGLREWLSEFQQAVDGENVAEIKGRLKLLTELGKSLEGKSAEDVLGGTTVQMGITDWLKLTIKPGMLGSVRNHFGVRSQITKLILTEPGLKAIRRFCGFFEMRHSVHALNLERDLQKRWSA
ncbi:MAG: hypothetical protein ABI432_14145 [Flavobacteriales bacterium]